MEKTPFGSWRKPAIVGSFRSASTTRSPTTTSRTIRTPGRSYEFSAPQPGDQPDAEKYFDFLRRQARELCTRYGRIHGFWWDANVIMRRDPAVNAMIRELQPGIIINNRGMDDGDFGTPERDWDDSVNELSHFERPVEACQSIGLQSWGYREGEDYYSDAHLIGSIHKILAKGGNYLLNVGPKADGTFPREAKAILRRIGRWLAPIKESLFDAEPASGLISSKDVLLTKKGSALYVHIFKEPTTSSVDLHPLTTAPRRAILLNTGRELKAVVRELPTLHQQTPSTCLSLVDLPVNKKRLTGWVVKLES